MGASPPLLLAAHIKELRLHALGLPANAGTQMLQLPPQLAQKDSALMTQLPLQMALATPLKQHAEPRELAASMLLNHVPRIRALNRSVMPSEERTEHRDAGILQLLLLPLLVP